MRDSNLLIELNFSATLTGPMSKESREERRLRRLAARVERDENKLSVYRRFAIWGGGAVVLALLIFGAVRLAASGGAAIARDSSPAPVGAGDWILGPENAPVTLIEYSDFECPACRSVQPLLKEVLASMPDEVRLIYRHFPLRTIHPKSIPAARAAEAAGLQGKFWQMHDVLFEKQPEWSVVGVNADDQFEKYAADMGLDIERFKADYKSREMSSKVNAAYDAAVRLRLEYTPTFFLNGRLIENPRSVDELKSAIQRSADPAAE